MNDSPPDKYDLWLVVAFIAGALMVIAMQQCTEKWEAERNPPRESHSSATPSPQP